MTVYYIVDTFNHSRPGMQPAKPIVKLVQFSSYIEAQKCSEYLKQITSPKKTSSFLRACCKPLADFLDNKATRNHKAIEDEYNRMTKNAKYYVYSNPENQPMFHGKIIMFEEFQQFQLYYDGTTSYQRGLEKFSRYFSIPYLYIYNSYRVGSNDNLIYYLIKSMILHKDDAEKKSALLKEIIRRQEEYESAKQRLSHIGSGVKDLIGDGPTSFGYNFANFGVEVIKEASENHTIPIEDKKRYYESIYGPSLYLLIGTSVANNQDTNTILKIGSLFELTYLKAFPLLYYVAHEEYQRKLSTFLGLSNVVVSDIPLSELIQVSSFIVQEILEQMSDKHHRNNIVWRTTPYEYNS